MLRELVEQLHEWVLVDVVDWLVDALFDLLV